MEAIKYITALWKQTGPSKYLIPTAILATLSSVFGYIFINKKKAIKVAEQKEIKVVGLYIYPIKSCAGISLDEAEVGKHGFLFDRTFMIVNAEGQFQTLRQHPTMALIQPSIHLDHLLVSAPGMPDLKIMYTQPEKGNNITVTIWSDKVICVEEPAQVNEWFSKYLNQPGFKLVRISFDYKRVVDPKGWTDEFPGSKSTSLSDGYPILLCTTESCKAVSDKSKQGPIPMKRYRPNIVIEGAPSAFVEDTWKTITIGSMVFHPVKPCPRCKATKVDPETGKVEGPDPLIPIGELNTVKGAPCFGQNLVHESEGSICVGDSVRVVSFWDKKN